MSMVITLHLRIIETTLAPMKIGRPKSKPSDAKSMYIRARVTKAERAEIAKRAKAAKSAKSAKTESEWIRQRLLGNE